MPTVATPDRTHAGAVTPETLQAIIAKDLQTQLPSLRWYGRPLETCMVKPTLKRFVDSSRDGASISLWLVFEEDPTHPNGYSVVYSEADAMFGLAVKSRGRDVFVGIYGSFVETLNWI